MKSRIQDYIQLRFGDWQSLRLLDVEASSLDEFKSVIRQFRDEATPAVSILMHSFSFVRSGRANFAMEQRFDHLLDFLTHEPGLEVVTVSQLPINTLLQTSVSKRDKGPLPYTGPWLTYWRAVEHARDGGKNLMVAALPLLVIGVAGGVLFFWRRKRNRQ